MIFNSLSFSCRFISYCVNSNNYNLNIIISLTILDITDKEINIIRKN